MNFRIRGEQMKIFIATEEGGHLFPMKVNGKHRSVINFYKRHIRDFIIFFKNGRVYDSFLSNYERSCYRNKYGSFACTKIWKCNKESYKWLDKFWKDRIGDIEK